VWNAIQGGNQKKASENRTGVFANSFKYLFASSWFWEPVYERLNRMVVSVKHHDLFLFETLVSHLPVKREDHLLH
jgi:hypothetical protein